MITKSLMIPHERQAHVSFSAQKTRGAPAQVESKIAVSDIQQSFKAALKHLAGSVTILATGQGKERRGLTATAVCTLSADPPSMIACVNRSASAQPALVESKVFSINILSDRQAELATLFGGGSGLKGSDRFQTSDWIDSEYGTPHVRNAVANIDCALVNAHDYHTHTVLIGKVIALDWREELLPLVYLRRSYLKLSEFTSDDLFRSQ